MRYLIYHDVEKTYTLDDETSRYLRRNDSSLIEILSYS